MGNKGLPSNKYRLVAKTVIFCLILVLIIWTVWPWLPSQSRNRPRTIVLYGSILIDQISKRFGSHSVVNKVSLDVADGELVVLLGSSGSGKSTILRMVAGLIIPDEGRILLNNADITFLPPQQRGLGFVFQTYSIFQGYAL